MGYRRTKYWKQDDVKLHFRSACEGRGSIHAVCIALALYTLMLEVFVSQLLSEVWGQAAGCNHYIAETYGIHVSP